VDVVTAGSLYETMGAGTVTVDSDTTGRES
jgi:hypothetical protein